MDERRVFERIGAPMKIKYEVLKEAPRTDLAAVKDISGTGIRLSLLEKLDDGTNLKLLLEMPDGKEKAVTVYGKVVWARKVEITGNDKSSGYYETGIEFTRADPVAMGRFFKHFSGR